METDKQFPAEEKHREIQRRFVARLIGFVLGLATGLAAIVMILHR